MRVLPSEGSSTSAREADTILRLAGHHVEICDPNSWCLARFSTFVREFHRCPGLRDDPAGYLGFIEKLVATGRFDVLLPTHEQGFLFARPRSACRFCRRGTAGFYKLASESPTARWDSRGSWTNSACRSPTPAPSSPSARCARPHAFRASSRPRSAPPSAASGSSMTPPRSIAPCGN
jgi:hypothetical protein